MLSNNTCAQFKQLVFQCSNPWNTRMCSGGSW